MMQPIQSAAQCAEGNPTQALRRRAPRLHSASLRALRGCAALLFLLTIVLQGTLTARPAPESTAAEKTGEWNPPPCAPVASLWHALDPRWPSIDPLTLDYFSEGSLLAEAGTSLSSAEIVMIVVGLGGFVSFYLKVNKAEDVLAKKITGTVIAQLADRHEITLGGQPIAGSVVHPNVEKPDFDRHTTEIWIAVTDLRDGHMQTATELAMVKAQREANGIRLIEIATKLDSTTDAVNRLVGAMEYQFGIKLNKGTKG